MRRLQGNARKKFNCSFCYQNKVPEIKIARLLLDRSRSTYECVLLCTNVLHTPEIHFSKQLLNSSPQFIARNVDLGCDMIFLIILFFFSFKRKQVLQDLQTKEEYPGGHSSV